jgi:hypothetical protein
MALQKHWPCHYLVTYMLKLEINPYIYLLVIQFYNIAAYVFKLCSMKCCIKMTVNDESGGI